MGVSKTSYFTMVKIKIVIYNNHTLGYIQPQLPNYVCILKSSILRGAPKDDFGDPYLIHKTDTVRPATIQDFKTFRHHLDKDYLTDEYEFIKE